MKISFRLGQGKSSKSMGTGPDLGILEDTMMKKQGRLGFRISRWNERKYDVKISQGGSHENVSKRLDDF